MRLGQVTPPSFPANAEAIRIRRQARVIGELRERIRQLEAALTPEITLPGEWGLVRREKQVFVALLNREMASPDQLVMVIFAQSGERVSAETIHSHVSKLRKKLRPFDVKIICQRHEGYRLEGRLAWKARLG